MKWYEKLTSSKYIYGAFFIGGSFFLLGFYLMTKTDQDESQNQTHSPINRSAVEESNHDNKSQEEPESLDEEILLKNDKYECESTSSGHEPSDMDKNKFEVTEDIEESESDGAVDDLYFMFIDKLNS